MDEMRIRSDILKSLIQKIARRVISKKLGKEVWIKFPDDIDVHSLGEKGERLKASFKVEIVMNKNDLFDLVFKED